MEKDNEQQRHFWSDLCDWGLSPTDHAAAKPVPSYRVFRRVRVPRPFLGRLRQLAKAVGHAAAVR